MDGGGHAPSERPLDVVIVGAGNRGGDVYGGYAERHPGLARVVAVVDADDGRRHQVADRHGVHVDERFATVEAFASRPRFADAAVIATPDSHHVAPTVAALERGYHVLLEKPIAPNLAEVRTIERAAATSGATVTVAHVLRYTPFFTAIKRMIDDGRLGRLVAIQHSENIGYWHFAHSYVRGHWRREDVSSPMILAKACHDLDVVRWLVGSACISVQSTGSLLHFRANNAPDGAPARCSDGCSVESMCPYSALRLYGARDGRLTNREARFLAEVDEATRIRLLSTSQYGRCVYQCDNDVADHQVVAMGFEDGVSAALTVSAFTSENTRTVHVMGSHGELHGHMNDGVIELRSFVDDRIVRVHVETRTDAATVDGRGGGGHAGGDDALMEDFVTRISAIRAGASPAASRSELAASIESHVMAFAAERSRRDASRSRHLPPDGTKGFANTPSSDERLL